MTIRIQKSIGYLLPALLLGGCATQPTTTEQEFGASVRQMIQAQINDPSTITNPSDQVVERTDGQMLGGALEAYRQTIADPASAAEEITISVGQ